MSSEAKRKRVEPAGEWVKASRIAALFDISEAAVYAGEAGLDQIASSRLPAKRPGGRATRRFYWPDAVALANRMLNDARERQNSRAGMIQLGRIRRRA